MNPPIYVQVTMWRCSGCLGLVVYRPWCEACERKAFLEAHGEAKGGTKTCPRCLAAYDSRRANADAEAKSGQPVSLMDLP